VASFQQITSYVSHWLDRVDQHSIHSPYFFDFYNKVIKADREPDCSQAIENIRAKLLNSPTVLDIDDHGSGRHRTPKRKLSEIVQTSASPAEYGQLMLRICQYAGAKKVVELGTSVGLTSLYLSHAPKASVVTFEGSHSLANVALTNFEFLERSNIELIEGEISTTLPEFLQRDTIKIGFAFVDANHSYEPTKRYFDMLMMRFNEKSIMVIDDIHNTPEMERVWNEISHHEIVYGSVDLYRCGILFFDPALNRQRFVWSL
jgi:predicted O-methyltransferase YrrM